MTDCTHTAATRQQLNGALVAAVDAIGDGAVITHGSSIIYANESFCAMSGMTTAQLVGRPWPMELLAPAVRVSAAEQRRQLERDSSLRKRYRQQLFRTDGVVVDIEASVVTVDTEEGDFRVSLFRDISREVAIQGQYEALLRAGATAHEGMIALDAGGLITSWNEGAEQILGVPGARAIGAHYSELVSDDLRPHADAIFRSLMAREQMTQFEFELRHASGASVPVRIAAAPTAKPGGDATGVACVIAPRHDKAPGSQPSPNSLLREQASHELRTPLAIAFGFLETLDRRWDSIRPDQQHRFVQMASASVERLFGTVERLLADAGIEQRTPSVTTVDLAGLLEEQGFDVTATSLDSRVVLRDDTCRGISACLSILGVSAVHLSRSATANIILEAQPRSSSRTLLPLLQPVLASVLQPVGATIQSWEPHLLVVQFP